MNKIIKNLSCITLFCVAFLSSAQVQKVNYEVPQKVGKFKDDRINEASGMAFSYTTQDAFWVHNDSGDGPNLFLINKQGDLLSMGVISGATSSDWEDMSSFVLNGKAYLIIGDFGDNQRKRGEYRLYIIEEPMYDPQQTSGNSYPIVRTIKYQYDNGKQNCESVAVDVAQGKIILFGKSQDNNKRHVYEIPLSVAPGTVSLNAKRIASLSTESTTAMDISKNGHRAVVLTYEDFAYEFIREEGETWQEAFNKPYSKIAMPIGRAGEEAIAYDTNGLDIYTVREGKGSDVHFLKGRYLQNPNSPNNATFVSQSEIPKILEKGETATVSVTMKNTGTSTWTKSEMFKLGSVDDDLYLGLNRVELDASDAILPNEEKTFTFSITGPNTPDAYGFQWRMIKENVEWLGEMSTKQTVVVLASNRYLDTCDSKTGWNPGGLILNTTANIQGSGTLEFSGSDTPEYYKVFTTPYNANGSESGTVLQFWYYVSDPSLFQTANQVEVSSSGAADVDEYSWSISGLKVGWNFIQLSTSNANKRGNPDLSAINWFRLYRKKNGYVTTRIDAIQLIGENSLGIDNVTNQKLFTMYPNPLKNELLTINLIPFKNNSVEAIIRNMLGQTVYEYKTQNEKTITINTNSLLKSQFYIVTVKSGNLVSSAKLIVE
tara:strand:- start:12995 stop:14968 length:1974 start_codon:yes stop_codon:yes gene_type:complete